MKVAVAQITSLPGRIEENAAKISSYIKEAANLGATLVVFPELSLPGYHTMDLAFNRAFLEAELNALNEIAAQTKGTGVTAIVGYIRPGEGQRAGGRPKLFNSAAILSEGKIQGFQDKTLLPDYDVFDEFRFFIPGKERKLFTVNGLKIGIEICEDLWSSYYEVDPSIELSKLGAEIIVNLSASPFDVGKFNTRLSLIRDCVQKSKLSFIYANLIGSFDAFDGEVVCDGRSIVMRSDGSMLGAGKAFAEDLLLVDLRSNSKSEPKILTETEEIYEALVLGIREYCKRFGFKEAIVGLSGGIDSAVVAALAVKALGASNVIGVSMPSKFTSQGTKSDADSLSKSLGITLKTIPIENSFDSILSSLRSDTSFASLPENVAEENIQPRIRMTILFALSNKFGGVVLNTGNKTELALGYCTIYGDLAGGLGVLADVNKERVYSIAKYINQKEGRDLIIPSIINRAPTAELRLNQTDEQGMGASPQKLSWLVDSIVDGLSLSEIKAKYSSDFEDQLITRTWKTVHTNEWKRRQSAPGIRVTNKAFGHGRRIPMAHNFSG